MPALPFAPREFAPDVLRFDSPSPIRDAAIRVAILATGVGKDHLRTIATLFSYNAGLTFCPGVLQQSKEKFRWSRSRPNWVAACCVSR